MSDPAFLKTLYARWQQAGDVDTGAMQFLGQYLADEFQPDEWRAKLEELNAKTAATLVEGEGIPLPEATRRANAIGWQALLYAQSIVEARAAAAEQKKSSPRPNGTPVKVERIGTVLQRVVQDVEHPARTLATPFPGLNNLLLGGFRDGELIYLGARPAAGKSALASEIALLIARNAGTVVFVSAEMGNDAVARRMLAQEGQLDASALRSGIGVDYQGMADTAAELTGRHIFLTDKAVTLDSIHQALDQVQRRVDLLVVDYLQLLQAPKIKDRRQQVESISVGLKRAAVDREMPVLALSSLNRPATNNGKEARPTLGSLRETGAMEHDADIVLLLHRDRESAETECLVAKNRDGRIGSVHLIFRERWVGFQELTQDTATEHADELFDREFEE